MKLGQSNAIFRMLATKHGYMPTEPKHVYMAEYANACIDDYAATKTSMILFKDEVTEEMIAPWKEALVKFYGSLNKLLEEHKGKYIAGDKASWADFACF